MGVPTKFPRMEGLVALRESRGLTQRQLAAEIGVAGCSVAQWERGHCYPSTQNLLALAGYFGCTTDEILRRAPPGREKGGAADAYAHQNPS